MKKVLSILISVLLVALIIFCVHSCINQDSLLDTQKKNLTDIQQQPILDNPNTEEDESTNNHDPAEDNTVYTETGIYHGRIDTSFIEVTLSSHPLLRSFKLSPELAKEFSSYNIKEESIISFEYKVIDGQEVITKIIR